MDIIEAADTVAESLGNPTIASSFLLSICYNETKTLSGACWNQKIFKPFLSIRTKVNVKIV